MRKILIPPRFSEFEKHVRAHAITSVTNYLIDQDFLPIMPFAHTKLDIMEEALKVADQYLDEVSGMILQGGNDVCPSWYHQKERSAKKVQKYRDIFEMALVKTCYERGIPMLGLCRGMQLINVVLGGTLHQELPKKQFLEHISYKNPNSDDFSLENMKPCFHDVIFEEDGLLRPIYENDRMQVNSYHHQGVDRLADGLLVEARSPDGLIEAFSLKDKGILGLQWHPELNLDQPENEELFQLWLGWCE